MQCPECNHIPLAGNQPDLSACPKCGVNYAEAIKAKSVQAQHAKAQQAASQQAANAVAPNVRKIMGQYRGAQPVVVLDVNMSFGSMVVFMIKWALAAIPALIILAVIAFFLIALFGGALSGIPSR